MSKFELRIDTDGDGFELDFTGQLQRVLQGVVEQVEKGDLARQVVEHPWRPRRGYRRCPHHPHQ
jgi:hypothetical protein